MTEGTARVTEDPETPRHGATMIGGRYMSQDRAEEFGARTALPEEPLMRVRVDHRAGSSGVAD